MLQLGSDLVYISWGSKERRESGRERREKGVLTAGHTLTTFLSECPGRGDREQLKCSEYIEILSDLAINPGGGHSNMKMTYKCLLENENRGRSV